MYKYLKKKYHGNGEAQLIIFPYMGGYEKSFSNLAKNLDPNWDVYVFNPPGHGLCQERPLECLDKMSSLYFQEIQELPPIPTFLYGHSMGAHVAYRIAILMVNHRMDYLMGLIISGAVPPHMLNRVPEKSKLSDQDFLDYIVSIGGIPQELIHEKELLNFLLPQFRADQAAMENHTNKSLPLKLPLRCLAYREDAVASYEEMQQWRDYTSSYFQLDQLSHGHMAVESTPQETAEKILSFVQEMSGLTV